MAFLYKNNGYKMSKKNRTKHIQEDYLKTLEIVNKQYQQYMEVSNLYKLPTKKQSEEVQYQPPSPEHPLTINTFTSNN